MVDRIEQNSLAGRAINNEARHHHPPHVHAVHGHARSSRERGSSLAPQWACCIACRPHSAAVLASVAGGNRWRRRSAQRGESVLRRSCGAVRALRVGWCRRSALIEGSVVGGCRWCAIVNQREIAIDAALSSAERRPQIIIVVVIERIEIGV